MPLWCPRYPYWPLSSYTPCQPPMHPWHPIHPLMAPNTPYTSTSPPMAPWYPDTPAGSWGHTLPASPQCTPCKPLEIPDTPTSLLVQASSGQQWHYCRSTWHPQRTSIYERPFTLEGNYLVGGLLHPLHGVCFVLALIPLTCINCQGTTVFSPISKFVLITLNTCTSIVFHYIKFCHVFRHYQYAYTSSATLTSSLQFSCVLWMSLLAHLKSKWNSQKMCRMLLWIMMLHQTFLPVSVLYL